MKRMRWIWILVGAATLAACTSRTEQVPEPSVPEERVEEPSTALSSIDSLLWQHPDSALICLLPYFDTTCRDVSRNVSENADDIILGDVSGNVSTANDWHYANLLLAELLYKNDNPQLNRTDLLQAVAYYDSLMCLTSRPPLRGGARRAGESNTHSNFYGPLFFLAARAHYINGVGYYEHDSVVEACSEYLKALEVMEDSFEEKELVGKKAKFMTYTYNRLGDMFSGHFMMDPAIICYKNSYSFSKISPISSYSISNALYCIGKQYNMQENTDSANFYYLQAIDNMPDSSSLLYRNIISTHALLSYQLTRQADSSLEDLKHMVALARDEDERLTRYLTIGTIYFYEGHYDSAQLYLKSVFENNDDAVSQIQAAEFLRILHDSIGDKDKTDYYLRFLALNKPMEYEADTKVSKLNNLFNNYLDKKQKQLSEKEKKEEREQTRKRTTGILIPILIIIIAVVIVSTRNKHRKETLAKEEYHQKQLEANEVKAKKELTEKDKRHAEAIETERQIHKMRQAALSGRLKQSNQELRELKDIVNQQSNTVSTNQHAVSFIEEPVCCLVLKRVNDGQFKSQMDCTLYKEHALNKEQVIALREAADYHFGQFTTRLKKAYPELSQADLDYCCLYLLGLSDADVSALMQKAYPTISQRSRRIRSVLGNDSPLPITLRVIANNSL